MRKTIRRSSGRPALRSTMAFCTLGAQQYDLRNGNARDRQVQDLRLALARAFRR